MSSLLRRRSRAIWILALAATVVAAAGVPIASAQSGPPSPETPVSIEVLSNRADLISGDNALVQINLPSGTDPAEVRVLLNDSDITDDFATRATGDYQGLVTGLELGDNILTATLPNGSGTRIPLTNHPIGGPLFSGPQIQPWYCLAGALDAQCNRPVRYQYSYKSSVTGNFNPYDPANPPSDLATTTTDEGKTVPYIVREEIGTQDRSQYRIAVLAQPGETWTRWDGPDAWNHKVWVLHGGGCSMAHSEADSPVVLSNTGLSKGFAVMSTALINNTRNCNLVVQAESLMMAKEHLIETYGDLRYMFGHGGSGGAIAQLWIANAYPGLYDGLIVGATMPDAPVSDILDCVALHRYFEDPRRWAPGVAWTEPNMAAASGKAAISVCRTWITPGPTGYAQVFDPRVGVGCDVPSREPAKAYHPTNNPDGVRCSFQDYLVNILGIRPPSLWGPIEQAIGQGFANRPYDNVGVQYGLRALMAGQITTAQFVDLNTKIGAVDIDYGQQAMRVETDPASLETAYRSGLINEGNNLDRVPIIDLPGGANLPGDRYEIHDIYKSWALQERLVASNGHHDNHAIWYGFAEQRQDYFGTMDRWLAAMEADDRDVPLEQKVVENRPANARDACEFPGNRATCDFFFGPGAYSTQWGAGGGIATDVIKCELKPLVLTDYLPIVFSDAQWAQLEDAFPTGVCDWAQPGVGQQGAVAWQTYQGGPGGEPLGEPPVSEPVAPNEDEPLATTLSLALTKTGSRYLATATLVEASSGAPISGQTIDFLVNGSPAGFALTDAAGRAQITLRSTQLKPRAVLSAVFAGTSDYGASSAQRTR